MVRVGKDGGVPVLEAGLGELKFVAVEEEVLGRVVDGWTVGTWWCF